MQLLRWKILKKKGREEELTADEKGILAVFDNKWILLGQKILRI